MSMGCEDRIRGVRVYPPPVSDRPETPELPYGSYSQWVAGYFDLRVVDCPAKGGDPDRSRSTVKRSPYQPSPKQDSNR